MNFFRDEDYDDEEKTNIKTTENTQLLELLYNKNDLSIEDIKQYIGDYYVVGNILSITELNGNKIEINIDIIKSLLFHISIIMI